MNSLFLDRMYSKLLFMLLIYNVNSWKKTPESELCEKKNLSCSNQMRNFSQLKEDCRMVYFPRNSPGINMCFGSTEIFSMFLIIEIFSQVVSSCLICKKLDILTECSAKNLRKGSNEFDLGTMYLRSYVYKENEHTDLSVSAFNVSFSNISWSKLSMRFTENSEPEKNSCRDFYVSENVSSTKAITLFYDCFWSLKEYEGNTYDFEYVASNSLSSEYHKYVFIVPQGDRINPKESDLSHWEVFMYVDVSSSQTVILKAQTVPKHYKVTTYFVKVHIGTYENSEIRDEKNITLQENDDEIEFPWNIGIIHGSYFFSVQPLSPSCPDSKCLISKSPVITISIPYNQIYVGIVLAAATLLILLCVCFKSFGSKGQDLPSRPSLLLIYRSTHTSHIRVVVELAKYLRKNCNIDAMVDELDVNRSKSQDPFDWYNGAISGADFIAVVSSPTCCNSINGIYPKAYDAALCLLRGSAFKRENFAKKCKLMVFMLPYGSKRHLPIETKNIGLHFKIPLHLMDVSRYIHNYKEMYFFEKFYYFVKARVKFLWNIIKNKNCAKRKCDWPVLQKAIEEATLEIKKCEGNRGRTDLKVDCSQQTRDIFHESEKETVALGDSLVIDSSTPPLDNATVFAEYPIPLDDIDLLGLKMEETDIENPDSRDDPLDHLQL